MFFRAFWMVLGSGTPVYRHESLEKAKAEAERLARLHQGQEFYVLEAVGKCRKQDIAWDDPSDEIGIPF